MDTPAPPFKPSIRTPDQRLRVFISSTLQELAEERQAAKEAIRHLRLLPVMFELGARPHPPRDLYRAYLAQSHIFVGIYWQRYGWVAPGESVSGLEDEYRLSGNKPKLIYVKTPAPEREARLGALLERIRDDDQASYRPFADAAELRELIENDLALLLTERYELSKSDLVPSPELPKTSLPSSPTPLIGRQRELEAVCRLLQQDGVRLVTLYGPGGIGKSRLALEAASRLRELTDVAFVALSAVSDPALVVPTIASVLGLREEAGEGLLETLKRHLRDKALLLLLDNFEQVVAAAPVVSELLTVAPKLKVLVTSRATLRLSAEHAFLVPPLSLPAQGERSPLETLRETDAVRLFVTRAKAVRPDFALGIDNALAVAEICYRLDGLPLAIELAAARVRYLPPQTLLARLDRRLELLTGGARDLPARQQTLRNTIDWSYSLLGTEEQHLLARLGVFAGGCTLEAVEAVCKDLGELELLDGVTSLIDKSLLQQWDVGAEPRFTMLETVRAYALERLEATGQAKIASKRHAEHFLALAEAAEAAFRGPRQTDWFDRLERDHDNLRAALGFTLTSDPERAGRLAGALVRFWLVRGHLFEGRRYLAQVLSAAEPLSPRVRAKALFGSGLLAVVQGDRERAEPALSESLALFEEAQDKAGMTGVLNSLGILAEEGGDYGRAAALYEKAVALFHEIGEKRGLAAILCNLGRLSSLRGDLDAAVRLYEEALAVSRSLDDAMGVATAISDLAWASLERADTARAERLFLENLAYNRDMRDKLSIADELDGLARAAVAQGEARRAARLWGAAENLSEALGKARSGAERASYERDLATARAQLEPAAFASAWAEGRALTLEGVVDYALSDTRNS